jgi:uncharacterized protein (TIGR03435 family)
MGSFSSLDIQVISQEGSAAAFDGHAALRCCHREAKRPYERTRSDVLAAARRAEVGRRDPEWHDRQRLRRKRHRQGSDRGWPGWMGSRPFDINAKVDAETAARWIKMTQPEVDEGRRSMTRSRLADRFHLKFHHETREMPTLVLRVAKSGSKLHPPHPEHDLQAGIPPNRINFLDHGHMEGHSALMSNLARSLASEPEIAGRPVVDKTGLTGGYDFTLRWTPDDFGPGAAPADPNAQWPTLFTALEEQLGIKLAPEKRPIDIIVVDSVEMPGEN